LRYERIALDTNAAVDFFRLSRPRPAALGEARGLVMPVFVLAELRLGVLRSARKEENLRLLEQFVERCSLLAPDALTAEYYVQVRQGLPSNRTLPASSRRLEGLNHDLWIAALCLQHRLPLLTAYRDFDGIAGLELIRW
jgi:predicted nucleic acid-binding protein